jgi:hypothetical protein
MTPESSSRYSYLQFPTAMTKKRSGLHHKAQPCNPGTPEAKSPLEEDPMFSVFGSRFGSSQT